MWWRSPHAMARAVLQKVRRRIAAVCSRVPASRAAPSGRRSSQQMGQLSSTAKSSMPLDTSAGGQLGSFYWRKFGSELHSLM